MLGVLTIGAALLGAACGSTTGATVDPSDAGPSVPDARAPYPAGMTEVPIAFGGGRRMLVYVPASLVAASPRAVVLVLHGGGGSALNVSTPGENPLAVFRDVADRERFVVVFPEGSPAQDGRLGWTDCRSDNLQASKEDDLGFLRAVVAKLRADYALGADRVFMSGTSNGGQMTLAFAAQASDDVAAIAISSANLPEKPLAGPCTRGPSRPIPALMAHGSADPVMPFAGGCVANLGGGCARGRVVGAEATRDAYLRLNGLASTWTRTETVEVDATDPGTAERFVYEGPAPVEWWRLNGAGHTSPSKVVLKAPTAAAGAQNHDVEFAELAWAFFDARLPK
jgi:polyhydroxybutyrate depolymerase